MTRDEMMSFIETSSEKIMRETGQCTATFFMVDQSDQVSIIGTPWRNEEEKSFMLGQLKLFFEINGAKMYGHVCEAWFRSFDKDEFQKKGGRFVESYEDKDEGVIMLVITPEEYSGNIRKIIRTPDGATLGESQDFPGEASGRLFDLLGTSPTRRIAWKSQREKMN